MDWKTICQMMRHADRQNEMAYQKYIKEMILEIALGWRPEQIIEQMSLQLGSTERLVPDLPVRKDSRNSFIIEVKKPGHDKRKGEIEQLMSYMKQLEIPVGIYWGDEVEIYWKTIGDGSSPLLLLSLDFNTNCEDGEAFVSLFSEKNYSLDAVRAFKEEREAKIIFETEVNGMLAEVTATEFQQTVKGLIIDHLTRKGLDEKVVISVMDKVLVSICEEGMGETSDDTSMKSSLPLEMVYQSRSRRSVGARPFAYNLIRQIIEKNRHLSYVELYALFRKKNYVETVSTIDERRWGRWCLQPEEILTLADGTQVAISNQWGFNNGSKPKMDFLRSVAERFGIDASLPEYLTYK